MKKLLILTNPYSGKKKGKKILKNVLNIFSNTPYDLITTKYKNHPYEIAKTININNFSGICIIGGDGTMHEVINGMLARADKKELPIGLVPGGTGNSFMHDMNCLNPTDAAKQIIKLKTQKIDLIKIETDNKIIYSFNVAGWGMPPDINILAEKMRWFGGQRYNIASLIEIMKFTKRQCNLIINNENILDDYSLVLCCNTIHTGKGMKIAPKAKLNDGLMDLVLIKNVPRIKLLRLMPKIFTGEHINDNAVKYIHVSKIKLKPNKISQLNIDGEIKGFTPFELSVLSNKIEIITSL